MREQDYTKGCLREINREKRMVEKPHSNGPLSWLLPERNELVQSIGNITASNVFGVNCVYNITLNGCDPRTAEALRELSCEYQALRFAVGRLINTIDKKGGAL